MIYVFDSNSLRVLNNYYPQQFPSFWDSFNKFVSGGNVISVKEVHKELQSQALKSHLDGWIKNNKDIFVAPTPEETALVQKIFSVRHFQQLVGRQQTLKGSPVADPFVIAAAYARSGWVVTEEDMKKNAARIPNVCQHFNVMCTNFEGFMQQQKWSY